MLDRAKVSAARHSGRNLSPKSKPALPSSYSNPAASPSSATNCSISFRTTNAPKPLARQTFLLSEFLEHQLPATLPLPQLDRKALVHGHCHHKAIMKMTAEEVSTAPHRHRLPAPAPGCCGMAGAFGFEKDKYEVSNAIGELELLPAVRNAPDDWLIVADGFSCREQIAQGTRRHALHLAEVLQMALNPPPTHAPFPESAIVNERHSEVRASMQCAGLGLTAIAAGSVLLWQLIPGSQCLTESQRTQRAFLRELSG